MKNSCKRAAKIAYFIDTFPRSTENFIIREIANVLPFWPNLHIFCLRYEPQNWALVDAKDLQQSLRTTSLQMSFSRAMLGHFGVLVCHPFRCIWAFAWALWLYAFSPWVGLRRFEQAMRLAGNGRCHGITHLHVHFASTPATIAFLAARISGITYSISAHAHDIWASKPFPRVLEDATVCIACSGDAVTSLQSKAPQAHLKMIPHGIPKDIAPPEGSHPNARDLASSVVKIVSGGRFVEKKGFHLLLHSLALLKKENCTFHCGIYGEGPQKSQIEDLVAKLKLAWEVEIGPFLPHGLFRKEIAKADLFILACTVDSVSGDQDGIPNVVLEAMSEGTVVVTTAHSPLRSLIMDGETGFMAENDTAEGLAATIKKALFKHSSWPRIRATALRKLSEKFNAERNAQRLVQVIEDSIGVCG